MILKSLKFALMSLAIFASTHAEAKVVQFQEAFSGALSQDSFIDIGHFSGQSTFLNGSTVLTTNHEVMNYPDMFNALGSFTRADNTGTFSGRFHFETGLPDYYNQLPNVFPVFGTLYTPSSLNDPIPNDPNSNAVANTGAYQYGFATGDMKGYVNFDSNVYYANFTIDWSVYTPDPISPVPEPSTLWLFGSGLLCLFTLSRKSII